MNINKIKSLVYLCGFLRQVEEDSACVFPGDYFRSLDFHKHAPSTHKICSFIWYEWAWRTNRGHLFLQMLFCNDLTSVCHPVDEKWLLGNCRQDLTVLNGGHGCNKKKQKNSLITLRVSYEPAGIIFVLSQVMLSLFSVEIGSKVSCYLAHCLFGFYPLWFLLCWLQCSLSSDDEHYLGVTVIRTQGCRKLRLDKTLLCGGTNRRPEFISVDPYPPQHYRTTCCLFGKRDVKWHLIHCHLQWVLLHIFHLFFHRVAPAVEACISFSCPALKEDTCVNSTTCWYRRITCF